MKKNYLVIGAILLAAFLYSCNKGGGRSEEVKLIPVKAGKEFQYIDQEGKVVINPQFSTATVFRDGLALVQSSGQESFWGFISEDGKYAFKANYKRATVFSDGLAWVVSENGAPEAINSKGEIKVTLKDAQVVNVFREGLAAYSVNDGTGLKWGFVDKEGKIAINPQFSRAAGFHNGFCAVGNTENKYGYIDKQGKIAINYQFDEANEFTDGRAIVMQGGKAGVIDEKGKYLINPQFSRMLYDNNMFLFEQDGKWGWCDKDGKIIINPQFGQAYPFAGNDLAPVQSGKTWGYVDHDGKIVINPQFDFAFSFNGKLAAVNSSSKAGLIDKDGKFVINPQYDDFSSDFFSYLYNGSSNFDNVETDYFDVNIITERIKKDITVQSVAGMDYSTSLPTIYKKYNKSDNDFDPMGAELMVIPNEKISNEATLQFQIGIFRSSVNATPEQFYYTITLNGRGYNKVDVVFKSFEGAFTGYTKDTAKSRPDYLVLRNNFQVITIFPNQNTISITTRSLQKQKEFEAMPGD